MGSNGPGRLSGLHVLVVGAGAMSGLAVATATRAGAAQVTVANRTRAKAERLAAGVGGTVADFADLAAAIAAADLVISCTGAANLVIAEPVVRGVLSVRDRARPAGAARPGHAARRRSGRGRGWGRPRPP